MGWSFYNDRDSKIPWGKIIGHADLDDERFPRTTYAGNELGVKIAALRTIRNVANFIYYDNIILMEFALFPIFLIDESWDEERIADYIVGTDPNTTTMVINKCYCIDRSPSLERATQILSTINDINIYTGLFNVSTYQKLLRPIKPIRIEEWSKTILFSLVGRN